MAEGLDLEREERGRTPSASERMEDEAASTEIEQTAPWCQAGEERRPANILEELVVSRQLWWN